MKKLLLSALLLSTLISCKKESSENSASTAQIAAFQPEMEENSVIYEVNIRQYSPEGTFSAFTKDIPPCAITASRSISPIFRPPC